MEGDPHPPKDDQWRVLKIAGVVAICFWLGNLIFGIVTSACGDFGARLGDSFGSVNALFSSIAVSGAIYALILQQNQIQEVRDQAAKSEKRQQELAELQAVSSYSQCLASCAQLTLEKYKDFASRIENSSKDKTEVPDISKYPPEEHENVVAQFQELLNRKSEAFEKQMEVMLVYYQSANQLLDQLTDALVELRKFPSVASKIPIPSTSEPKEESSE